MAQLNIETPFCFQFDMRNQLRLGRNRCCFIKGEGDNRLHCNKTVSVSICIPVLYVLSIIGMRIISWSYSFSVTQKLC